MFSFLIQWHSLKKLEGDFPVCIGALSYDKEHRGAAGRLCFNVDRQGGVPVLEFQ